LNLMYLAFKKSFTTVLCFFKWLMLSDLDAFAQHIKTVVDFKFTLVHSRKQLYVKIIFVAS
jgi:hypothetical protein